MTSFTLLNEIDDLENIIDSIESTDEESILTEENTLDLIESALHLMDTYIEENPTAISEPDFHECFFDEIKELFYIQFEDHFWCFSYLEETLDDILLDALNIFLNTFYIERSFDNERSVDNDSDEDSEFGNNCHPDETPSPDVNILLPKRDDEKIINLQRQIDILRGMPQPVQRTNAWYKFRHNLITASNAYKAFESQSMINQLIYEKCQPLKTADDTKTANVMVNVNTTLHWGQKYEPLSVMFYEYLYNTKIEDFGCIQHEKYSFIGASPDGINVDIHSERFGRMLEIKNIVNREINGIPKKEYWIQMQLQMEVCDLPDCDFLETKFTEYENANEFYNDGQEKTAKNEYKGVIAYFQTHDLKPFYVYKPIEIKNYNDINKWEEETIEKYEATQNMFWVKNCYWKLEKLSCVFVSRNQKWFQDNIGQINKIWKIIEEERVTGYQHRAPNKKQKKETPLPHVNDSKQGCLLTNYFFVKKIQ